MPRNLMLQVCWKRMEVILSNYAVICDRLFNVRQAALRNATGMQMSPQLSCLHRRRRRRRRRRIAIILCLLERAF